MSEISYVITEKFGVITKHPNGWAKELNKVSWADADPKWDVRDWNPDHTRMGRGITLTDEQMRTIISLAEGAL